MKIKTGGSMKVGKHTQPIDIVGQGPSFVIEDQFGNRWRLSDSDRTGWSFELTMIETSMGHLGSLSLQPITGNVIVVSPS